MENLIEWFEEKDYAKGLILLAKYSKNRILLQNLSRKQNPKKLEYELKKITDLMPLKGKKLKEKELKIVGASENDGTQGKDPEPIPIKGTSRMLGADSDKLIIVRNNLEVKLEDLPEKHQTLWKQNRDSYKQVRALHEKLKLMENASDEGRKPLIDRIRQLDESIRANWEIIDAWQPGSEDTTENGIPDDDSAIIAHKRINANRKYISINMQKLAEEKNQQKAGKLKAKLQERVNELKAANEELKPKTIEELKSLGIEC